MIDSSQMYFFAENDPAYVRVISNLLRLYRFVISPTQIHHLSHTYKNFRNILEKFKVTSGNFYFYLTYLAHKKISKCGTLTNFS
jgi:hypothetical protein